MAAAAGQFAPPLAERWRLGSAALEGGPLARRSIGGGDIAWASERQGR